MIYDITKPVKQGMAVWPGDPPVKVERTGGGQTGQPAVSHISLSSHSGTHVDPPIHFLPEGATVDDLPPEAMIGPAWLAVLSGRDIVTAEDLAGAGVPPGTSRLLIRTRNSEQPVDRTAFDPDFVALNPGAAAWLLERGVRLVGIDGPSIEPFGTPPEGKVHRMLLGAGVIVIENLALAELEAGPCQLICLPIRIAGGDGAPARVVIVRDT